MWVVSALAIVTVVIGRVIITSYFMCRHTWFQCPVLAALALPPCSQLTTCPLVSTPGPEQTDRQTAGPMAEAQRCWAGVCVSHEQQGGRWRAGRVLAVAGTYRCPVLGQSSQSPGQGLGSA